MKAYDIIVVGAGPAGSTAAKVAAEKGARVILIEEHRVIGLPRHCAGRLHGSSITASIVENIDNRVLLSECKARTYYSPKGVLVLKDTLPPAYAFMLIRDEFDRELARGAANAGVDILLNAKVTGLHKDNDRISGVMTSSRLFPTVKGRLVICAQGSASRATGIPAQEKMSDPSETFAGGVLLELQNVSGLKAGINEIHMGELSELGFARIWTRDDHSCWVTCPSLETFEKLRNSRYLYGARTRNARVVQIHGWVTGARNGEQLPHLVKDGLMLVGDSAGYISMTHAMVSGRHAAEVAVDCLGKGNISQSQLGEYQKRCEKMGLHLSGNSWKAMSPIIRRTDEEIERLIPIMIANKTLSYVDTLPF